VYLTNVLLIVHHARSQVKSCHAVSTAGLYGKHLSLQQLIYLQPMGNGPMASIGTSALFPGRDV
jgi:hypothetical protein